MQAFLFDTNTALGNHEYRSENFTTDDTDSTDYFKKYADAIFLHQKHVLQYNKKPHVREQNIINYPCKSV